MSGPTCRGNNDPQGEGGGGGGDPAAAAAATAAGENAPDFQQLILTTLTATNNALAGHGIALQNLPADMVTAIPAPPSLEPAAGAGAAPPPPTAVRSPFHAPGANVIDFHSKEGKKLYEQVTCSLFSRGELFKVEPEWFQLFLNCLNKRTHNLGMLGNGANDMVPLDAANPAVSTAINMITRHGQVTLEQV